jgi:hypothetical protein
MTPVKNPILHAAQYFTFSHKFKYPEDRCTPYTPGRYPSHNLKELFTYSLLQKLFLKCN